MTTTSPGGLGIEDARRAGDRRILETGNLRDAAFRRQVAAQYREMALCIDRLVERADNVLVGARLRRHRRELRAERAAGYRHAVGVQEPRVEQHPQHLRHATGTPWYVATNGVPGHG